jgi:cob(I)alamin adenosyltransferase
VASAWLDLARTVVRRAERHALTAAPAPSLVGPYLNRLSDLLWTMARWQDAVDGSTLRARDVDAGGQT